MYACDIKFVGINVRGRCLISENHEHLYPRNIRYTVFANLATPPLQCIEEQEGCHYIYKIAMPVHLNEPLSFALVLLAITFNSVALVLMDNNKGVYDLNK